MNDEINFDLSELSEKRQTTENPFERFGLSRNPFPRSAIADAERARAEQFSRCRKNALETMKDFIKNVYLSKRWSGLILRGEIGSGKSHTLFYVTNEINRQLSELDQDSVIAIFVESPKDSINELFQEIMEKISRELFEAQVAEIIKEKANEILVSQSRFKQLESTTDFPQQDVINHLRKKWKLLGESGERNTLDMLAKELAKEKIVQHRDFARCLGTLILNDEPEERNSAWRFITGRNLTKSQARDFGLVSEKLSEDEITRFVLPSVIQILNKNDVAILFLFIDEAEKIATRPQKQIFSFLENLRSLIDNNLNGFSMIFSCQTESWDVLASTSPALSDRMNEIVDLDPLSTSEAVFLIEDYLAKARPESFEGNPLFPFDESVVDKIALISKGSIRYILQNCHTILAHAASTPDVKVPITSVFVERILGR